MKRVLLIAYHYPPRPEIGSIRPGGLAKHLPQFGWEPIILTPRLPAGSRPPARVIETEYRNVLGDWKARFRLDAGRGLHEQLRLPISRVPRTKLLHTKVIDLVKSIIAYPDPMKGWLSFAVEAMRELQQSERIDAVLSTAPPVTCHLIGRRAKEILKCPWVADFRELWTQNRYYPYGRIRRVVDERLETKIVRVADVLVTLSASWAQLLRTKFSNLPVHWITNGFDSEEFPSEGPELTKAFSITYTGQLYGGKRDPSILFKVIADLIKEGVLCRNQVVLRFYGPSEPWLPALVQCCGLNDVIEIRGIVPRDATLRHQQESQLLLLLNWDDPADAGTYTGKLFEYLGSRRPVIAIGGAPGVEADLLEETKAGVYVRSEGQLRAFLIEAYKEYQQLGRVSYAGDETVIRRYTHLEMARKFANVLDMVAGGGQK